MEELGLSRYEIRVLGVTFIVWLGVQLACIMWYVCRSPRNEKPCEVEEKPCEVEETPEEEILDAEILEAKEKTTWNSEEEFPPSWRDGLTERETLEKLQCAAERAFHAGVYDRARQGARVRGSSRGMRHGRWRSLRAQQAWLRHQGRGGDALQPRSKFAL